MAIRAVYHTLNCELWWDDEKQYVTADDEWLCPADEIDDVIEALQRIKADLARAKGGVS